MIKLIKQMFGRKVKEVYEDIENMDLMGGLIDDDAAWAEYGNEWRPRPQSAKRFSSDSNGRSEE